MFERHLTDLAGGNISVREGDTIYITPRYADNKWRWKLNPSDIVSGPVLTDELKSHPSFSREGISHLTVYRSFPEVRAIIHAHPFHILPFCAEQKSIPPVLRSTRKYGEIKQIADSPAYSQG
jgi:L-fuculose-phosphate aldolase